MAFMRDEKADDRLPRLRHWLAAAAILFVTTLAVPLFAAFL